MRNMLAIFIMCVVLTNQTLGDGPKAANTSDPWQVADIKLSEFLPRLQVLGEKHLDDVEIQLGLAFLYSRPEVPHVYSREDQIEKVLMINADTHAAWALKAKLLCFQYTAKRRELIDRMHAMIKNSKINARELKIMPYSQLYPWLKELGTGTIVINDFDGALKLLREKLDSEMLPVLVVLKNGEQKNPENALYNYLKAHLYFELGEENKAIREIENAVVKKHINNYVIEEHKATARVLREVGFPENQLSFIVKRITLFADAFRATVWERGLVPLAENYESQGAIEDAGKIYKLTLRIAEQIRDEPLPYPSGYNEDFSNSLEKWARQDNNKESSTELRGKEKKMLGISRTSVGKYLLIAASCGILIVGIILFLRKKSTSRSNRSDTTLVRNN